MTATIVPPASTTQAAPVRRTASPIPTTRLVKVELRKMFNTRSGFWMLVSIGVLAVLATGAVIIFAPDSAVTYESFATAIGFPMSVILPMIAILAVRAFLRFDAYDRGLVREFIASIRRAPKLPARRRKAGAR